MRSIFHIASISIRELLAKKTLYVLLFILILVLGAVGSQLYTFSTKVSDPQAQLAQKADVLMQMMEIWSLFTVYFVMGFAAFSIHSQIKSKSIIGVLAKPISRAEFLLGRWMGVASFFSAIILIGAGLLLAFMFLWELPVNFLFFTGVVNKIGMVVVYSALAFVLSLFLPTLIGGGIAFILFMFREVLQSLLNSSNMVVEVLGYILFYGTPAPARDPIIRSAVLDNLLDPNFGMYWKIIFENFAFAGLLLFAGILLYQNKDITLN